MVAAPVTGTPGVVKPPVPTAAPVLVASGAKVGPGVSVAAGVLVGATSAVKVRAEENVDTAYVCI